ncbi:MAG: alpha/beta hydrolase [Acidobacteriota bacterium]|nr:MAG: alpha/beta hydrolase [Acidobacteriota bacterium]
MRREKRIVELPGRPALEIIDQGYPNGTPLVLLHGVTDSCRSFDLAMKYFPQTVRAISVSHRGHGGSDKPENGYTSSEYAKDLLALLDFLGLEAPVIAGHSMGSMTASRFAFENPGRVSGLALISAFGTFADKVGIREFLEQGILPLEDPIDPAFVREFQESTFSRPIPEHFFETIVGESLKVPARIWKAACSSFFDDDVFGQLSGIKARALLIWGDEDAYSSRSDQEILLDAIRGSRLKIYQGTGHAPHWEEPERFARDVVNFVTTVEVTKKIETEAVGVV